MEGMIIIVIKGNTPAQKNKKKITARGGRPRMYTEKVVVDWQKDADIQIKQQFKQQTLQSKVTISYMFFVPDMRRKDSSNMVQSVDDALVKAGVIADDDWQHLACGGYDSTLDRENPRAEIYITVDQP